MDRLSCLPDDVLCHILSFLLTKFSVQTSVLSKRWRFIWAHVPFLEFFVTDRTVNSKIISKIVFQHKHDIHTFKLYLKNRYHGASEEEFESWIVNVTTRNIRNLDLELGNQFVFPRCVFTCKTLVYLSLSCSGDIPMSGICFPLLKKLQLVRVCFESHESLAHLISSCPVLEELSIIGNVLGHCCVSSPTLTRLELGLKNYLSTFGVKLGTPALRYLQLFCFVPNEFLVGALDSLIEAHIILCWDKDHRDKLIHSRNVLAFVGKLYNVKRLTLTTNPKAVVQYPLFSGLTIKFNNLTKLDLKVYYNLGFVTCFLENANNLRILRVDIRNAGDLYYWMEPKRVPKCLISHLREVKIRYFWCSEDEFDMIRYILMNAEVLKMMKIHSCFWEQDWKKKFEGVKRGSKKCELVLD